MDSLKFALISQFDKFVRLQIRDNFWNAYAADDNHEKGCKIFDQLREPLHERLYIPLRFHLEDQMHELAMDWKGWK